MQCAFDYYSGNNKRESYLQQVLIIWNELFPNIRFKVKKNEIIPVSENGEEYIFNDLSDGEKTVFYYIGHVVMAERNSYIIVDEPENHMNSGLCKSLWNILEILRQDCSFIYATHDLSFAETRLNSTILWNKKYLSPINWDVQEIDDIGSVPEDLVLEIIGSKSIVVLCEGMEESIDIKLYTALFPNLNIKGVGGHSNVIKYVSGYKSQLSNYDVIGIIDRDWHSDVWCTRVSKNNIIILNTNEVENIICDKKVIKAVLDYTLEDDNDINTIMDKYLDKFWNLFSGRIDEQAKDFTVFRLNEKIRNELYSKNCTLDEWSENITNDFSSSKIHGILYERKSLLEQIYTSKDYERAIRIVNFKGAILRIANDLIFKKYVSAAVKQLRNNKELKRYIIDEYFDNDRRLTEDFHYNC